jgi:hypothetical protein
VTDPRTATHPRAARNGHGIREQPALPGLALGRDDPPGIGDLRTAAIATGYRWCCAGSCTGPEGAVVTPACRCTPDPVPPRPPIHGQRGPAFPKCRARVGTVPGVCATALAGAHLPIASWRIVRHLPAARVRPGGTPGTGNADDAHAGPGWRTGPEMSRAGSAARLGLRAGVAQVRAVRRDAAAAAMQAVTSDQAGGGSDEISAGRSMR